MAKHDGYRRRNNKDGGKEGFTEDLWTLLTPTSPKRSLRKRFHEEAKRRKMKVSRLRMNDVIDRYRISLWNRRKAREVPFVFFIIIRALANREAVPRRLRFLSGQSPSTITSFIFSVGLPLLPYSPQSWERKEISELNYSVLSFALYFFLPFILSFSSSQRAMINFIHSPVQRGLILEKIFARQISTYFCRTFLR